MALQKRIIALVPDLLAASRIAEAAKRAGLRVEVIESRSELDALLPSASLLVLDLGIAGSDMAAAAARAQGVPVIAFGRHNELARTRAAQAAGIDRFYPRGRFLGDLAAILQQALAGASVVTHREAPLTPAAANSKLHRPSQPPTSSPAAP